MIVCGDNELVCLLDFILLVIKEIVEDFVSFCSVMCVIF